MSRRTNTRWVVIVEGYDGSQEVFGPWYDDEKAGHVAAQLRGHSARYNSFADDENAPDYDVSVCALTTWPGIRKAMAS